MQQQTAVGAAALTRVRDTAEQVREHNERAQAQLAAWAAAPAQRGLAHEASGQSLSGFELGNVVAGALPPPSTSAGSP